MNATTQLETIDVNAEKSHGLGNQQPSAVASMHGEGSTIIHSGVGSEQNRSARCLTARTCSNCEKTLPIDNFYFNRKRNNYDYSCKTCVIQRSNAWQKSNPEKFKEISRKSSRKFFENNPERRREISRAWYSRNIEAQRARIAENHVRFAERRLAYRKWYEKQFPEKTRARSNKRRAIKARAIPIWADFDAIKAIYVEAQKCGLEVDHIVPLNSKYVSGLHCEANMQLLPRLENIRKGNRWWPDMP